MLTKLVGTTVALMGSAALAASPAHAAQEPPSPVASVQVDRYLGRWYQIAAVPALYEIQCLRNVTADYGLSPSGTVTVRNACRSFFDIESSITGDAKPLDATNARLNVSFLRLGGTWQHNSDANYIVIGLSPTYRWAVVTDAGRRSGFVLSRTPTLSAVDTALARRALRTASIDPCTLRTTIQDNGATKNRAFC